MAKRFTVAELVVGVRADLKQFKFDLREGLSAVKGLSAGVKQTSADLAKGAKMLAGVSAVAIGAGTKALMVFADLEQSIANTASVTGGTSQELKKLEGFARKMGKETVFTATQAGNAMYYLASAGYNTRQIFSSLEPILALAAATQYDLSEATATVVSTLRAFNLDADQASRVTNVFAAAISTSQATMLKLQESMKYIAPVASNLNYEIEGTVAALSLLFNSGLEASMSGTQLRMALTRLLKPTRQARQAMQDLGLEAKDLDPSVKGLVDIIGALEDANAGAAENADKMAQIFGVRSVNAMNILLTASTDTMKAMEENITNTTKAADMQQRQIDTLRGSWRLMISAFQESSIIVGSVLAPAVRAVIESFRQLNLWFAALPGFVQKAIVGFNALAAVMGVVVAANLMLLAQLPKMIAGFKIFLTLIGGSVAPLLAVSAAVIALTGGLIYLISAQEREKRQRQSMLADYNNVLNARIKEQRNVRNLANSYDELAKKSKLNETQQNRMNRVVKDINTEFPNLVDETKEYSESLTAVKEQGKLANDRLTELEATQKRMRQIKLGTDIAELRDRVKELEKELTDFDIMALLKGRGAANSFRAGIDKSTEAVQELEVDLLAVDEDMANIVMSTLDMNQSLRKLHPNYYDIQKLTEKIASSTDGNNKVLKLQGDIIEQIAFNEAERVKIQNRSSEASVTMAAADAERKRVLDSVDDVLVAILGVTNETAEMSQELVDKRKLLNELLDRQLDTEGKITQELEDREFPTDRIERADLVKQQRLEHEIAVAGITDRRKLRQQELEQWRKDTLVKIIDSGKDEAKAKEMIASALARKQKVNDEKYENEMAQFRLGLFTKQSQDVLAVRIAQLNDEKRRAMQTARDIGASTAEVEASYLKQTENINRQHELQRREMLLNLVQQTQSMKSDAILDADLKERTKLEESFDHQLEMLKVSKAKELEKVKQGYLDREDVEREYKERQLTLEEQRNNEVNQLQANQNQENARLSDELLADKLAALAAMGEGTKTALEREQAIEDAAYKQRSISLDAELAKRQQQVLDGRLSQLEVDEWYRAKSSQLEEEYSNNKKEIDFEYENYRQEMMLNRLDQDSLMYDQQLENYRAFLVKQQSMFKENTEMWLKIQNMIDAVDNDMYKKKKARQDKYKDFMGLSMDELATAAGKSLQGQTRTYKDAMKTMVKAAIDGYMAYAKAQLLVNWNNPVGIAKWGGAMVGLRALEHWAYGAIDRANTGGKVQKSGLLQVHTGETIVPSLADRDMNVPAKIHRASYGDYLGDLFNSMTANQGAGVSGDRASRVEPESSKQPQTLKVEMEMNFNAEGAIITGDQDSEDMLYERIIRPAERRFKESLGEVIDERFTN